MSIPSLEPFAVSTPDPAATGVNYQLLANSAPFGWAGIAVHSYRLPPHPELIPVPTESPSAAIHLHMRGNTRLGSRFDGLVQAGPSFPGLTSVAPMGAPYAFSWDQPVENLIVFVATEFLTALAGEVKTGDPARARLIWNFNFSDPLMETVSHALLSELQAANPHES